MMKSGTYNGYKRTLKGIKWNMKAITRAYGAIVYGAKYAIFISINNNNHCDHMDQCYNSCEHINACTRLRVGGAIFRYQWIK